MQSSERKLCEWNGIYLAVPASQVLLLERELFETHSDDVMHVAQIEVHATKNASYCTVSAPPFDL